MTFRESIELQASWDRKYVKKVLSRNLNAGADRQHFLVAGGMHKHREWVRQHLESLRVEYHFWDDTDHPRAWICWVWGVPAEGAQMIQAVGGPPKLLESIPRG